MNDTVLGRQAGLRFHGQRTLSQTEGGGQRKLDRLLQVVVERRKLERWVDHVLLEWLSQD